LSKTSHLPFRLRRANVRSTRTIGRWPSIAPRTMKDIEKLCAGFKPLVKCCWERSRDKTEWGSYIKKKRKVSIIWYSYVW
jgi:hypothetical protein